ncbi:hypothetical protein BDZ94DRAFT_1246175 [Collybia nuda]|uniref:Uncharacterized protein n=1 Tax=Collybia nuda TaxID=64659 RepID=A0A9P6CQ76_9AGAR|nr:hypothetical protein BDZ94DRAFT_1246175 [Collybia nuda]
MCLGEASDPTCPEPYRSHGSKAGTISLRSDQGHQPHQEPQSPHSLVGEPYQSHLPNTSTSLYQAKLDF